MTLGDASVNEIIRRAIGLHERGDLAEAEAAYRQAIAAQPTHADANCLLGAMLGRLGRYEEAFDLLNRAIQLDSSLTDAFLDRANVFRIQGKFDDAISDYQRAIELAPKNEVAYGNLARVYRDLGKTDAAVECMETATQIAPAHTRNQLFFAEMLCDLGAPDRAIERYQYIIENDPGCVEAINNLAVLLKSNGQVSASLKYFRRALDLNPTASLGHTNLGLALLESAEIEAAEERLRMAISLDPYDGAANSNLLLCLNYRSDIVPEDLFAAHQKYAERLESACRRATGCSVNLTPGRRLRVAYVSPDFKSHSVSRFIAPILAAHDQQEFEVFCFANVRQPDEVTQRFRQMAGDRWRDITGMSDVEVSQLVQASGIDILVDLAGHSAGNRLGIFARKPAPVQLTYLGYPASTGLSNMDYRLTDSVADPPGLTDAFHSEKLLRFSECFLCFDAPRDAPNVAPLAARKPGEVTFGSFNNASKINDEVLIAWSKLLGELPASRLVIKAWQLGDEVLCRRFQRRFARLGVSKDRIELSGWLHERNTHLQKYNTIDIALDTFPYNGTTTTCEALWMGVPVVTLAGGFHAFRVGASLLQAAGVGDLAAETIEQYIDCARNLAHDLSRLASLRSGLRQKLRDSPLTDAAGFTRKLETAYRSAWQSYCDGEEASANDRKGSEPMASTEVEVLRLHIGGEQTRPGWKILNAVPGPHVDFLGSCTDLSRFSSATVDQVYASHVLEHLGYQRELPATLHEIYRVLKPGGTFFVSVPDLEVLCRLFLDPRFPEASRFELMRIFYGGQIDDYDFHKIGLTWEFLHRYLEDVGFTDIRRTDEFGLFDDTSTDRVEGQPISLNVIARK